MLRALKDGALGLSLKALINEKFGQYGDVKDCSVDTKNSKLVLHLILKGEREPVTATIERYEIERDGMESYISLKSFSSSREWLGLLLNRFLKDKRYKLPSAVTKLL